MTTIYADNAATTQMSRAAIDAMLPYLETIYGNPSSLHSVGQQAAGALLSARDRIAKCLNASPREIYFTSGGSEADNQAILSAARLGERKGKKHIISTAFEHHAVLHTLKKLEKEGFTVELLPVGPIGTVTAQQVKRAIREDTCLVSVMYANNEIGSILPISAIGAVCREAGVLFHTDAVQAVGHLPIDVKAQHIDMLSLSGHKFHGPKGVGALYISERFRNVRPLLPGGGQEMGLRSGTEATAQIAGFAKAVELRCDHLEDKLRHMAEVKAYAVEKLSAIPDLQIIGSGKAPHVLSVSMAGWPSQNVVNDLGSQGICVSAGSACHHGKSSQVVSALGLPKRVAAGVIRLSFGPETTFAEIDACAEALRNHHDHRMPML